MNKLIVPVESSMVPNLHLVAELTLREPTREMSMLERLGLARLIQKMLPEDSMPNATSE